LQRLHNTIHWGVIVSAEGWSSGLAVVNCSFSSGAAAMLKRITGVVFAACLAAVLGCDKPAAKTATESGSNANASKPDAGETKTPAAKENSEPASDSKEVPGVSKDHWGDIDKQPVYLYTLKNKNGLVAKITNWGATLTEMHTPDKDGKLGDIVLGWDTLE